MEAIRFTSELLEIENVNEESKILTFSVQENFIFKAGQYMTMAFYKDGKRMLRSYSICSSPSKKGKIKVYFKKVKEGFASNKLFNMKIGEKIEMKGPSGFFAVDSKEEDIFLISSGTGFGPFRSIVLDLLENGFNKKLILIRGYRTEKDLCCKRELDNLKSKHSNFVYYDILSQPKSQYYLLKGRVQKFIPQFLPKDFKGKFYLCGLKEMVLESRETLEKLGISKDKIFSERYS